MDRLIVGLGWVRDLKAYRVSKKRVDANMPSGKVVRKLEARLLIVRQNLGPKATVHVQECVCVRAVEWTQVTTHRCCSMDSEVKTDGHSVQMRFDASVLQ